VNPSVPTGWAMLGRSTRLKDRRNPNCPNCPSLLKKMRGESSTDTPCGRFPGPGNFLKIPGPTGTAGTDRYFNTLAEPAPFTGWDVWGRRKLSSSRRSSLQAHRRNTGPCSQRRKPILASCRLQRSTILGVRKEFLDWREVTRKSGDREADNRLSAISATLTWTVDRGQFTANWTARPPLGRLTGDKKGEKIGHFQSHQQFVQTYPGRPTWTELCSAIWS
jgi:hypothetical protein